MYVHKKALKKKGIKYWKWTVSLFCCNPSVCTGWLKKNRTYKNFIESYKVPVNFKYFAGLKLQSVYNHSPKFQSLKSLGIKVKFFPKYSPNGLHGVGGKLAYVVQNCQLLEHILLWVFHWFCTVPYSLNFWIQSKILLFDGAWW